MMKNIIHQEDRHINMKIEMKQFIQEFQKQEELIK